MFGWFSGGFVRVFSGGSQRSFGSTCAFGGCWLAEKVLFSAKRFLGVWLV